MKTYKVYCEYYIKAEDKEKAEQEVIEDMCLNNFFEEHIQIEETELPKDETYFNNWKRKYILKNIKS